MNRRWWNYSKGNACPDCGKLIMNESEHCTSCAKKGKRSYQWKGGESQLTEEIRIEEMQRLRNNGLSYAAIGEFCELSRQRVHQILGSDGKINSKGVRINKEWLQTQIEIKGRFCSNIAEELGTSYFIVEGRKVHYGFKRNLVLNPGEWPIEPAFKGANGYLFVWSPFHPHANHQGRMLQHRLVAEKYLGRYLHPGGSGEASHHIDGDRTNNEPENLCIFESIGYHTVFHRWLRGECRPIDESHITWVVPESRERMIGFCGWPEND